MARDVRKALVAPLSVLVYLTSDLPVPYRHCKACVIRRWMDFQRLTSAAACSVPSLTTPYKCLGALCT